MILLRDAAEGAPAWPTAPEWVESVRLEAARRAQGERDRHLPHLQA